jgi:hypothetical protein
VTVVNPEVGVQPVVAFQPIPDPDSPTGGSESEGSSGFALSPPGFPDGLNQGVFIGFHGLFNQGGLANDENPMVFADPVTGRYFNFVSNNLDNIGHLDEIASTADSLFVADISSTGELFGSNGLGAGTIYQIQAIASSSTASSSSASFAARVGAAGGAIPGARRTGVLDEAGSRAPAAVAGNGPLRAHGAIPEIVAWTHRARIARAQGKIPKVGQVTA